MAPGAGLMNDANVQDTRHRYLPEKPTDWRQQKIKKMVSKVAEELTWNAQGVASWAKVQFHNALHPTWTEVPCGRTKSSASCDGCSNCSLPRRASSDGWPFPCDSENISPRPHAPPGDYRAWYLLKLGSRDPDNSKGINRGSLKA